MNLTTQTHAILCIAKQKPPFAGVGRQTANIQKVVQARQGVAHTMGGNTGEVCHREDPSQALPLEVEIH